MESPENSGRNRFLKLTPEEPEMKPWVLEGFTLAPIWLPHWPAWMWTISLILKLISANSSGKKVAAWLSSSTSTELAVVLTMRLP
jgi:hypothetical protein